MELWQKILLGIGISLVTGYLIFSVIFFYGGRDEAACEQFVVKLSDGNERTFVTEEELINYIKKADMLPQGDTMNSDRCKRIENIALQHQMVRTATCYNLSNGDVQLEVTQREPKLRVCGKENYFVDADRKVMPIRSTTATDVMIITGNVSQKAAQTDLFDFVEWLTNDDFWDAQIVQIDVESDKDIALVPRVGTGVILLGSLDNYEAKLHKLKKLYRDGFSKLGWKNYREIDLRYRGQIVCR